MVAGRRLWEELALLRPGARTAVLFWQNITGAPAEFVLSEAAVHDSRGLHPYCHSRPAGSTASWPRRWGLFP